MGPPRSLIEEPVITQNFPWFCFGRFAVHLRYIMEAHFQLTWADFSRIIATPESTLHFLEERRVIPTERNCEKCEKDDEREIRGKKEE